MAETTTYNFLFSNMKDGICITGRKGDIRYANNSASEIFHCPMDEILGKRIWEIIPITPVNDTFIQMFIDSITNRNESHESIVDYESQEGRLRKLRVCMSASALSDESGDAILIVITDITELVRVNNAFVRYTSKEIANQVLHLEGGDKLGGEKKDISVLISDLRGFTALSTQIDPSDLITLLNHYFEVMAAIIEERHGTIMEFLGDSIFVVFGAPSDLFDHASQAVACALEMQSAMDYVNTWNRSHGYPDLQMGIGINSGDAIVGNIGSIERTKYGCIGETVNLAGRIESLSSCRQILISENTKNRITDDLKIIGQHSIMPKGARRELLIYDIAAIGGQYNASFEREAEEPAMLSTPIEIAFRLLSRKNVLHENNTGFLYGISKDQAILGTDISLALGSNIELAFCGDVYGKIIKETASGYILSITSAPTKFYSWLNNQKDPQSI